MSSPTGRTSASGGSSRGNPAPRRALSRFSPLDAEGAASSSHAAGPVPVPVDRGEHAEPSSAAAAGGTRGRDLLIPGPASITARGKNGRPVPSLADLMPPAAPAGRRSGGHGRHTQPGTPATRDAAEPTTKKGGKDAKSVELAVRLSKPVRKRLKARAAELGLTPQEAVARLVEVWLED